MANRKKRIKIHPNPASKDQLARAGKLAVQGKEQEILSRAILLILWRRLFERAEHYDNDDLQKLSNATRTLFDCTLRLQTLELKGRELELKNEERLLKVEALRQRLTGQATPGGGLSPEILAEVERQLGLL